MSIYQVGIKYKNSGEIEYTAEFDSYEGAVRCKFYLDSRNNNTNYVYFIEQSEEAYLTITDEDEELCRW